MEKTSFASDLFVDQLIKNWVKDMTVLKSSFLLYDIGESALECQGESWKILSGEETANVSPTRATRRRRKNPQEKRVFRDYIVYFVRYSKLL